MCKLPQFKKGMRVYFAFNSNLLKWFVKLLHKLKHKTLEMQQTPTNANFFDEIFAYSPQKKQDNSENKFRLYRAPDDSDTEFSDDVT